MPLSPHTVLINCVIGFCQSETNYRSIHSLIWVIEPNCWKKKSLSSVVKKSSLMS